MPFFETVRSQKTSVNKRRTRNAVSSVKLAHTKLIKQKTNNFYIQPITVGNYLDVEIVQRVQAENLKKLLV